MSVDDPSRDEKEMDQWAADRGVRWTTKFRGSHVGRNGKCSEGHPVFLEWRHCRNLKNACTYCSGLNAKVAEAKMELWGRMRGYTWLDPYVNKYTPRRALCSEGHDTSPAWGNLQSGHDGCLTCAGHSTEAAAAAMDEWAEERGYVWLEDFPGANNPRSGLCELRHEVSPRWNRLKSGVGGCFTCSGVNPEVAAANMELWASEHGYVWIDPYEGALKPRRGICNNGHDTSPAWNTLQQGDGGCLECVGHSPRVAAAAMDAWGVANGFTWIDPYVNCMTSRFGVCSNGHEVSPRWNGLQQGEGGCGTCATEFDWFYVLVHESGASVKFGVTSGDPWRRLRVHRRNLYSIVIRSFPHPSAYALERKVIRVLNAAGWSPIQGNEYFEASSLDQILDLVDADMKVLDLDPEGDPVISRDLSLMNSEEENAA